MKKLHQIYGNVHKNNLSCNGYVSIFTARKRSLRRLCFYRCLSFCPQGGCAWLLGGRACFYLQGGVVLFGGGHAWFYLGGAGHVWFYSGGPVWFYSGGMCGFIQGGMHGFIQGGCAWFFQFFSFFGYNEIRSMSGRYASYWNAFLSLNKNAYQNCVAPFYEWH